MTDIVKAAIRWSNPLVWVFVENHSGAIRRECLQPDEQPLRLRSVGTEVDSVLRAAVEAAT